MALLELIQRMRGPNQFFFTEIRERKRLCNRRNVIVEYEIDEIIISAKRKKGKLCIKKKERIYEESELYDSLNEK